MSPLVRTVAALGFAFGLGCGVDPYACERNEQCVVGANAGRCEPEGYCSYADSDCPGGSRYSDNAGGSLAGNCVELKGDGSSSEDGAPNDAEGSGGVAQGCGNGVVEAPEACDDGNRTDGDGCSSACLVSGTTQWSWTGPTGTSLTGLDVAPDGLVVLAGNDDSGAALVAFAAALTGEGMEAWPPVTLAAESTARSASGVAVGEAIAVAGYDAGSDAGTSAGERAWSAQLGFDGSILGVDVDDTAQDERWGEVARGDGGGVVLVGDAGGRARIRWSDANGVVDWDLTATEPWLAAAGRGDGVVAVVLAATPTEARFTTLGRGGPPIGGGDVDGEPTACAFARDGGLAVAGQRSGTPWLARHAPDGTLRSTWSGSASGRVLAVAAVHSDIVVATDQGSLVRIDPDGQERWRAPTAPDVDVRRLAVSASQALLVGGTSAAGAWVGAHVP